MRPENGASTCPGNGVWEKVLMPAGRPSFCLRRLASYVRLKALRTAPKLLPISVPVDATKASLYPPVHSPTMSAASVPMCPVNRRRCCPRSGLFSNSWTSAYGVWENRRKSNAGSPIRLKLDGVPGVHCSTVISSSTPAVSTGKVLVVASRPDPRQGRNQTRPPAATKDKLPGMRFALPQHARSMACPRARGSRLRVGWPTTTKPDRPGPRFGLPTGRARPPDQTPVMLAQVWSRRTQ